GAIGPTGAAGGSWAVTAEAGSYTVVAADDKSIIEVSAAGGVATVTLPAIASAPVGFGVIIKKVDSTGNQVRIAAAATSSAKSASSARDRYGARNGRSAASGFSEVAFGRSVTASATIKARGAGAQGH
ncbi:MAG: hypothetical protein WCJ30_28530, partial [Deltaproteobacteria bacterium]